MSNILIVDNHQATIKDIDKHIGASPNYHQVQILCANPEDYTNENTIVIKVNEKNGYNRLFKAIRDTHQRLRPGQRLLVTGMSDSQLSLKEVVTAIENGIRTKDNGFVEYTTVLCNNIQLIGKKFMFEEVRT